MLPPAYPTSSPSTAAAAPARSASTALAASGTAQSHDQQQQLIPHSFPAWDAPPQCSYGWFVDVPPPRGPYLWPAAPEGYRARQDREKQQAAAAAPVEESKASGAAADSLSSYVPQLVWGWFCAVPPPQPPYFWPSLPEGYVLVRLDEVESAATPAAAAPAGPAFPPSFTHSLPQRSASHVTAAPLAAPSTLPTPHPIATASSSSLTQSAPSSLTQSAPLPSTAAPLLPTLPAAAAADSNAMTDVDATESANAKGGRGAKKGRGKK